jgi:hypothetical protein
MFVSNLTGTHIQLQERLNKSVTKLVMKERSGFSGGFKIPEEQRKKKKAMMQKKSSFTEEDDLEGTQQSAITKDEVL